MSKREAGAEEPKEILSAHLTEEDAAKLNDVRREIAKLDLHMEREEIKVYTPKYQKRREIVKAIDNFWPVALMHHDVVLVHVQHKSDQSALSYLQDVWVTRHKDEHRAFTIEFTFKENPFFSDKVLTKEFKHNPPKVEDPAQNKPNEHGITDAMLEFDSDLHLDPSTVKINWKDDDHNLTKLYPRVVDDEDDDVPAESGSFFNFFEQKSDPFGIGEAIGIEIFPNAIDYFMGDVQGSEIDSDEEDDEEDDEDEEEIDLEKPRPKKRKV